MAIQLKSRSFTHQGDIPAQHTCEGADESPALSWSGLPAGTASLVLIVDDPDAPDPKAPKMTWVHWVLFNIPPDTTSLPAGISPSDLPGATGQGLNDWRQTGYRGPCPPVGRHRYFFKLYALASELDLRNPTKADVEREMQGHVLGKAELIGYYEKGKKK